MSQLTLKAGIERILKQEIPEVVSGGISQLDRLSEEPQAPLLQFPKERSSVLNSLHALGQAIYQAGFDAFATVPANPLQRMLPVLKQALLEERYPDFVDGDLEKRVDPRRLQSSAQTVITLAVSYNTGPPGSTPPLHGTISRSAWGLDYHTVLQERMNQVIGYLREHHGPAARRRIPAPDRRALAVEGWVAGSNCVSMCRPSSWVFLGEPGRYRAAIYLRGNRRTGPALSTAISHQSLPHKRALGPWED